MPLRSVSAAYLAQAADLAGNPGQQAAYDSTGHCVVLAGPGSGKTKTLVLKLARIMAEDVRAPRGAACITYSQECARELTRRLERLGLREAPNLFIGTVHGFCLRHLLMPYGRLADLPVPFPLSCRHAAAERPGDEAGRRPAVRRRPSQQADGPWTASAVGPRQDVDRLDQRRRACCMGGGI